MAFVQALPITKTIAITKTLPRSNRTSLSRNAFGTAPRSRRPHVRMQQSSEEEPSVPLSSLKETLRSSKSFEENDVQSSSIPTAEEDEEDLRSEAQKEIDRLRAAEKFIEIDEGKFECMGCAYVYEPEQGDKQNSIPPGTLFQDLPSSYSCPACRTPKNRFVSTKKVIAGFADNQSYGFGSNTLTGGQKNLLIFGGLALCFLLLLSGYALN